MDFTFGTLDERGQCSLRAIEGSICSSISLKMQAFATTQLLRQHRSDRVVFVFRSHIHAYWRELGWMGCSEEHKVPSSSSNMHAAWRVISSIRVDRIQSRLAGQLSITHVDLHTVQSRKRR